MVQEDALADVHHLLCVQSSLRFAALSRGDFHTMLQASDVCTVRRGDGGWELLLMRRDVGRRQSRFVDSGSGRFRKVQGGAVQHVLVYRTSRESLQPGDELVRLKQFHSCWQFSSRYHCCLKHHTTFAKYSGAHRYV